jgi:hypothetical protein
LRTCKEEIGIDFSHRNIARSYSQAYASDPNIPDEFDVFTLVLLRRPPDRAGG